MGCRRQLFLQKLLTQFFESALNTLLLSICTLPLVGCQKPSLKSFFSKIRKASQYLCLPGLNFRVFMELRRVLGEHKYVVLVWVLFGKKISHRIQSDSFPHNIILHKKPSVYKRLNEGFSCCLVQHEILVNGITY